MSIELHTKPLIATGDTSPAALATAVTRNQREQPETIIDAIGPAAVNVAVKAVVLARKYVKVDGFDLTMTPDFITIPNRDRPGELTGLRFVITRVG